MSAPHPLSGCRNKLLRAKEHTDNLHQGLREEIGRQSYGAWAEIDPSTRQPIIKAHIPDGIRVLIGLVAGDVVQNLRAALDYLAWQLVILNGNDPSLTLPQFPIFIDPAKYREQAPHRLAGMSDQAIALIERAQPYHATLPADHLLWVLHEMSNWDKHRVINIAEFHLVGERVIGAVEPAADYSGIVKYDSTGPLIDGTEVRRLAPLPPGMKVQFQFALSIRFDDLGPGRGRPVIPLLEGMGSTVEQTLLTFKPLFDSAR